MALFFWLVSSMHSYDHSTHGLAYYLSLMQAKSNHILPLILIVGSVPSTFCLQGLKSTINVKLLF